MKRFFPGTVRGTLVWLLLIVLVPLLLAQAAVYYVRYEERRAHELQTNLELARGISAAFAAYVRDVLTSEYAMGQTLTEPFPLRLEQMNEVLAGNIKGYSSIRSFNWFSPQGVAIASSRSKVVGLDYGDRSYIQEIQKGREWIVSDLVAAKSDGKPAFSIARGIRDRQGNLLGIMVAGIDPDHLGEALSVARAGDAAVGVLDSVGRTIYRYPEVNWTDHLRDVYRYEPTVRLAQAESEAVSTKLMGVDGQWRWGGFVRVAGTDWVAVATRPEAEVNAQIAREIGRDALSFVLVAFLGSLAAMIVGRRLTVPIEDLREHAVAIGKGEFGRQTIVPGPIELAQLAGAINHMGIGLQEREQKLGQLLTSVQHQAAELAAVVEHTQAQLALLDRDLNFVMVNSAYERGCGFRQEELVGRNHFTLFPHPENQTIFERVRDTGEPYEAIEKPFEFLDRPELGTTYWNWVLVPINDDSGQTRELLLSLVDVTDLVRARQSIEASVKMRDEFLSIAAHELKTPVTSLRGFAQVLLHQYQRTGIFDPERMARGLQTIDRQSKRLTELTAQLLDLSRLSSGKLALGREETDVSALVERVVVTVRYSYQDRVVGFRPEGPVPALVDGLRLEQVVINLLDNALKFSPAGEPVEVEVGEDGAGWVRIGVRDHGTGIPADQRAQVFDRYFQANQGKRHGGMGIGLFVSREIVEMHEGSISIEQPEDGGSLFVVRLPRRSRSD